ncbi:MAG: hypothetical protein ACLUGU_04955 [Alistipes shahii]
MLSLGDENADIIKESSYAGGYYLTRVGQPVGCYYLLVQDGIFHNQEELDSIPISTPRRSATSASSTPTATAFSKRTPTA